MSLKCGIVGLPNVGKSTLFNALTKAGIAAENYPFCTIEPNVGIVELPDPRLGKLADIVKPERIVPAIVEFVDIAGLVAGASKGEGLGNRFLSHIRETQAILHVVRCFDDGNVLHVADRVDPLSDMGVIETELALADLETVEKALYKTGKLARGQDKEAMAEVAAFEKARVHLQAGQPARSLVLEDAARLAVARLFLITAKPVLYVANVSESDLQGDSPHVAAVRRHAAATGAEVVVLCAELERQLAEMGHDDRQVFLEEMGLQRSGLERLVRAAFHLLGLQTFYTAGPKEIRAWTIRRGDTAPAAAGVIHSDFEKNFIRLEAYGVDDLVELGTEAAIRAAGRLRSEGRGYVMHDADVAHFLVGR